MARTQLAQAVHTEFEQWAADFVAESAALNRDMLAQQRAVWGAAEPPPQVKKKRAARTSLPKYSTCFTAGVPLTVPPPQVKEALEYLSDFNSGTSVRARMQNLTNHILELEQSFQVLVMCVYVCVCVYTYI